MSNNLSKKFPKGIDIYYEIEIPDIFQNRLDNTDTIRNCGKVTGYNDEYLYVRNDWGQIIMIHESKCILSEDDHKMVNRNNRNKNINDLLKQFKKRGKYINI